MIVLCYRCGTVALQLVELNRIFEGNPTARLQLAKVLLQGAAHTAVAVLSAN
jgi:hypothetical protein